MTAAKNSDWFTLIRLIIDGETSSTRRVMSDAEEEEVFYGCVICSGDRKRARRSEAGGGDRGPSAQARRHLIEPEATHRQPSIALKEFLHHSGFGASSMSGSRGGIAA